MAYTDNNTIALKISPNSQYIEYFSGTTISPGMLVEYQENGFVYPHTFPGGAAERLFVMENGYKGLGIMDDYLADERVMLRLCRPGDIILCLYSEPNELWPGQMLSSVGDGTLRRIKGIEETQGVVAVSLEKDLTPVPNRLTAVRIM